MGNIIPFVKLLYKLNLMNEDKITFCVSFGHIGCDDMTYEMVDELEDALRDIWPTHI